MVIISDGKLSRLGMQVCEINEWWVNQVLVDNKVALNDVLLLFADKSKNYQLIRKDNSV